MEFLELLGSILGDILYGLIEGGIMIKDMSERRTK
jgi:hypothetical protein